MDSNNKHQADQSSQSELDLGLNQVEPITPKKTLQTTESIFDKAKGLFGKKESVETKFTMRKEPTFGETQNQQATITPHDQIAETGSASSIPTVDAQPLSAAEESEREDTVESAVTSTEDNATVEPNTASESRLITQPEKWKVLQILPAKHRRLFIAILALVLLLIIFFALKPNSDTVEAFTQPNSNEIPVQFQSLDQDKPVENTILDHTVNAPAPSESAPQQMEYVGEQAPQQVQPTQPAMMADHEVQAQTQTQSMAPVQQASPAQPVAPSAVEKTTPAPQPAKKMTESQVVHKSENVEAANSMKKDSKVEKQQAVKTHNKAPVVESKPVTSEKKPHQAQIVESKPVSSAKSATAQGGAHKTLTVPKGVSLMQVFRDHQLNISDVNAMSKAAGAGNVLSSFKSGDKVHLTLNRDGRVTEMRLDGGARFVRQSDGSYQYKK